jgi:hypothetical protein
MLALTRTLTEFTVLSAIIALGMTGGKLLRDQVRESTDSRDRLLAGILGVASLLMLGLAVAIFTPLVSSLSSISAIAGLQAGLLLLVIAAAGLDTLESAQSERRLRKSLASYKQALEDLKQIEEQRREQLAQDYKLQIQQLLEGLMPPRAQEPGEKIWIVPEQETFSIVPQRPELPMTPARPGYRWPRAS